MPYVKMYIDASEFIDDLSDEELVSEVKERGFKVIKGSEPKTEMHDVIWRYKNGYIEDAVYLLMKAYPELHGLDKYIKRS